MQSSYRVIKNDDIAYGENIVPITNIKIREPIVEKTNKEKSNEYENNKIVDIDKYRQDLEKKIREEIEEERQDILNKAMEEAKEEIENLKKEAINQGHDEGYKKGHDKGFEEGVENAFRKCEVQCNEIKKKALNLIKQAEVEADNYFNETKDEIINLAGVMAESIVHKTIDTSDEKLLSLINPIIEQYEGKENITLTCHPDSIGFLKDNIKKLEELNPEIRFIILEDNNLEENGCTIENESQIIDLQIKNQINSIIQDLKNMEV